MEIFNWKAISNHMNQNGFEQGVMHLLVETLDATRCLDYFLYKKLNWTAIETQSAIELGCIYLNNKRLLSNTNAKWLELQDRDYLRVHTKPRRFPANHFDWQNRVIYDHADFLVIHKPSGLPCHPTVDNIKENLLTYLENSLGYTNLGITHRLDLPTSGLIVIGKNKEFVRSFNQQIVEKQIEKIYVAIVSGPPLQAGLYTHYMKISPKAPKEVLSREDSQWHEQLLKCDLKIISTQYIDSFQCLQIQLLTGRTHQIRAQLACLKNPIVGDTAYHGQDLQNSQTKVFEPFSLHENNLEYPGKILLCAQKISFAYNDQKYSFEMPPCGLFEN